MPLQHPDRKKWAQMRREQTTSRHSLAIIIIITSGVAIPDGNHVYSGF